MAVLEQIKYYRTFKAGEQIYLRHDNLAYVASVVSGVASLNKTLEDGRTQTVGLLFGSDFIGRPGRARIDFDVYAATNVTLCCFERKQFERIVEDMPHIAQRLMEIALDELDAARDWMMLLGRKTALEKTASFLEILVRRSKTGSNDQIAVDLPLTREEIANYLGLTLETVSRQFAQLKKRNILRIESRRTVVIDDLPGLIRVAGDDTPEKLIQNVG